MDKKWVRAVWKEDGKELELAIPSIWVEDGHVRWPNTSNATSALKEQRKPTDRWLTFDLVKIKFSSDDYKECENFDETTAVESDSDSEPVMKRKPKKKVMNDFIMDSAEDKSLPKQKKFPVAASASVVPPKPPKKLSADKTQTHSSFEISRSSSPSLIRESARESRSLTPSQSWASSLSRESSINRSLHSESRSKSLKHSLNRSRHSKSRSSVRSLDNSRISKSRSPVRSFVRLRDSRSRSPVRPLNSSRISSSRSPERLLDMSGISRSRSYVRSNRLRMSRSRSPERSLDRSRSSGSRRQDWSYNRYRHSKSRSYEKSVSRSRYERSVNRSSRYTRSRSSDRSSNRVSQESNRPLPTLERASKRTSQPVADTFPMTEERFQRRVLYLLVELRDLMKTSRPSTSTGDAEDVDHAVINTEDFETLEGNLQDINIRANFKCLLQKIGGIDGNDHMKKSMLRTMTNSYMAGLNMKGKRGKKAFASSQLYQLIKNAVLTSHKEYTESKFNEDLGKFLKYAPERVGGGGRKKPF